MTQSKTELEKALKLSRKLRKETASIQELADNTEKTLDDHETQQGPKDHDEQLRWVQVCQLVVNKCVQSGLQLFIKDYSISDWCNMTIIACL